MWDLYDDDESFQRLARGKGHHDANLLAKVLYGKKALVQENKNSFINEENKRKIKSNRKTVKFRKDEGKFTIDPELQDASDCSTEFDYLWRSQDYSYKGGVLLEN